MGGAAVSVSVPAASGGGTVDVDADRTEIAGRIRAGLAAKRNAEIEGNNDLILLLTLL